MFKLDVRRAAWLCAAALAFGVCCPVSAQIMTVGSGCAYTDLQQAVNAAPTSGAEIHLASDVTNQHLNIDTKSLSITGGFAHCADASPTVGLINTISAGSHTGDSVVTIRGASAVVLQNLKISDGKESDSNYGGGIDFVGQGSLVLRSVLVTNNKAGYGGGINMSPTDSSTLSLENGSNVFYNTGTVSGGGVRIQGKTRFFMIDGTTRISFNSTTSAGDGHGGGLQVIGPASAEVGSGTIENNTAQYGGGISVENKGVARLFAVGFGYPTSVSLNKAGRTGGGIYVKANTTFNGSTSGIVCAYGYTLANNSAQNGAALYVDTDTGTIDFDAGGTAYLTKDKIENESRCGPEPATQLGAVYCPVNTPCNQITGNEAKNLSGDKIDGSTIVAQTASDLEIDHAVISGNRGQHILHVFGNVRPDVYSTLISDNTVDQEVVYTEESDGDFLCRRCTIAGNALTANKPVFSVDANFTLTESIVWQPGNPITDNRYTALDVRNVMANEVGSIGGVKAGIVATTDPGFKFPSQGNYRLSPLSAAVDFTAPPPPGEDDLDDTSRQHDLDNNPRVTDLGQGHGGPMDLGAYELQSLAQFPPDENFDDVTAGRMPNGWTTDVNGFGSVFNTEASFARSAPNAMFTADSDAASNKNLRAPIFTVAHHGILSYYQWVDLGTGPSVVDGATLLIAIGDDIARNTYTDIKAAGGVFLSGDYYGQMTDHFHQNGVLPAWTGQHLYWEHVIVQLPPAADGKQVSLLWDVSTNKRNAANPGGGYWLDDMHVEVDGSVKDRVFCGNFETTGCAN